MAMILAAAPVVEQELKKKQARCAALKAQNVTPTLKVFLVGEHAPSVIYTNNKKKNLKNVICLLIKRTLYIYIFYKNRSNYYTK